MLLLGVAACGSASAVPDAGAACVRSSATCDGTPASYAATVAPLLDRESVSCHFANSPLARTSLATYTDVQRVSGTVIGQLSACLMPPAGQPGLTSEERATLLTWLACGAPDN